ncbi:MAG: hypothetical protein ACI9MR_002645 [Myxococcota bacterium]
MTLLLSIVSLRCGTVSQPLSEASSDRAAIVATVQSAMQAGLVNHDLTTYMAIGHPNATLTWSRGPVADAQIDVVMDRAIIHAIKRQRWSGTSQVFSYTFEDAKLVQTGNDHAFLKATIVIRGQRGYVERNTEVYQVTKRDQQWFVTSNWFWVESITAEGS